MSGATIIGIAGGSGSGKTTVARALAARFGPERVAVLVLDAYYKDQRERPLEERRLTNYDHPDAFDEALLGEHLAALKAGRPIRRPVYDYATHARTDELVSVPAAPVIVFEGILVLAIPSVRDRCDVKIFVDTDADLRFTRRLRRDVAERARTVDSVIEQYLATVRPMHLAFCEPSKRFADLILPEGLNDVAFRVLEAKIESLLRSS
ncbi:uridine kinase [bacterium]|nr:uridine kinase [bacterium]